MVGGLRGDPTGEVLPVGLRQWFCDQFIDHRLEVVEGSYGREWRRVLGAVGAASSREQKGRFDQFEGDSTRPELGCELAVGGADLSDGARYVTVEIEESLDVAVAVRECDPGHSAGVAGRRGFRRLRYDSPSITRS